MNLRSLIPEYWKIKAKTQQEFIDLGSITVSELIKHWRQQSEGCVSHTKSIQDMIDLFNGKNADKIVRMAKRYTNPTFPRIGKVEGSFGEHEEPLDADSLSRKSDSTTFNCCGWCKYVAAGVGRYGYAIEGGCKFEEEAKIQNSPRRTFNTICVFKSAPDSYFKKIINGLKLRQKTLAKCKKEADNKVTLLNSMLEKSEKRPVIPEQRPYNCFNVGDTVVCYIRTLEGRIVDDIFIEAKVIPGYRHHDGFVSVACDTKLHTGDNLEGYGLGYYYGSPIVLQKWEFEYLKANPKFTATWVKNCEETKYFNRQKFLKDIAAE